MKKICLEVLHEGEHCIPCVYMTKVVESVASDYDEYLQWEKIVITKKQGALRFDEISKKLGRPAPVPSIFINGELVFDMTPGVEVLKAAIEQYIQVFRIFR